VTRYPTQKDIFATVREEGILLDKFLNKINFKLKLLMASKLDFESEKIIKFCYLERRTTSIARTRAYSSALKILMLFGSLTSPRGTTFVPGTGVQFCCCLGFQSQDH